tara:strand:- start:390 stop:611 length:222 start_codon:yes stop_codon:yes gene_type:complete
MIDTDKCEHILYDTMFNPLDVYNVAAELLVEVKRLRDKLFEAEVWIDPKLNETNDYTFENDIRKLHYIESVEE